LAELCHQSTRCDFAIDGGADSDNYNYKNLENGNNNRKGLCDYTPKSILALVNDKFDCNFAEIFIDNYDLECEGVMCESPK